MTCKDFIRLLGQYKKVLSRQEVKVLRGQALGGDVEGARRGLERVLARGATYAYTKE